MKYFIAFLIVLVFPVLAVHAQTDTVWWELTITDIHQENQLEDVFMSSYTPRSGETFLAIKLTLTDVQFDAATSLPSGDMLLQGVRLYGSPVNADIHSFSLADVLVRDNTNKSYSLYGFSIGSDLLIAPNLTDFSVAAPYEEVTYTFVFSIPQTRVDESLVFIFEGLPVVEIIEGQAVVATEPGDETITEEATATEIATEISNAPVLTSTPTLTPSPTVAQATEVATFTPTPSSSPTLPPLLLNISTKSSFEIYTQPTTGSERLLASNESFSPHVAGVNSDYSWVYIYFFTSEGLQDGWIRSSRINLEEPELENLPIIAPENLPPLPALVYSEEAAPFTFRLAIATATQEASIIHNFYILLGRNCPQTPENTPIREGDIITFQARPVPFERIEQANELAQQKPLVITLDRTPFSDITYEVRESLISVTGYVTWEAEAGSHIITARWPGEGQSYNGSCHIEVIERFAQPTNSAPTSTPEASLPQSATTENVSILERPDETATRLLASAESFSPYVGGIDESGSWIFVYYFDLGQLKQGWIHLDRMTIPDTTALIVIDPDNLPATPKLPYRDSASPPGLIPTATPGVVRGGVTNLDLSTCTATPAGAPFLVNSYILVGLRTPYFATYEEILPYMDESGVSLSVNGTAFYVSPVRAGGPSDRPNSVVIGHGWKPQSPGTYTITASIGNYSGSCTVTVE